MKIGIRLPSVAPLRELVATAQRAEDAGLDMVWCSDSPLNYREVWSVLGAISISTSRINIGPMVTNLASRHETITASAARTISESAPGRFTLGLGVGDSAVGFDTLRPARLSELERGVNHIRSLMRGDGVAYGDFEAHLRDAREQPPIYVAAAGPKTLSLGGRIADGVVMNMGRLEAKMERIAAGAAEAGRERPPVYILSTCAIVDDPTPYLPGLRLYTMRTAQLEGVQILEEAGFKLDSELLQHRMGAHGDIGHAANIDEAAKAVDGIITDEMALWYMQERTFLGTRDQIVARFRRLSELGISGAYLAYHQTSQLPTPLIDVLAEMMPDIKAL